jgi:hypothetical protein
VYKLVRPSRVGVGLGGVMELAPLPYRDLHSYPCIIKYQDILSAFLFISKGWTTEGDLKSTRKSFDCIHVQGFCTFEMNYFEEVLGIRSDSSCNYKALTPQVMYVISHIIPGGGQLASNACILHLGLNSQTDKSRSMFYI